MASSSAHRVSVAFELEYVSCDLADERVESLPYLRTYFDAHFVRSEADGGIINTHLDEHDLGKVYEGTLTAHVNARSAGLPETACIGFAAYAMRRNEYGMACYTEAGTSHVRLGDIIAGLRQHPGKPYEVERPLLMETARITGAPPLEKGRIRFRARTLQVGPAVTVIKASLCPLGAPMDVINAALSDFIEQRVNFEASLADTWPGIKNVRAPMDISSAGVELTQGCFVPIEGFALAEPDVCNVGYFQNALERSLKRRGLDVADMGALDVAHRAELAAELFTFAAESFDYISDSIDFSSRQRGAYDASLRAPAEIFSNMGVSLSGDCEDGAKFIQTQRKAFMQLALDPKTHPELHELQQLSSQYVYFLTLATVHGAKAEDNTEHIGAHMFGLLLPKRQVKEALSLTPLGVQVSERLPLGNGAASSEGELQGYLALPTLFCEGTGRIRPLGTGPSVTVKSVVRSAIAAGVVDADHPLSYDPLIAERRYVAMMMKSKGGLKTEIPHDFGAASPFYLGNLLGVTGDFMDLGFNVGAFIFGQHDAKSGTITRGAQFVDIINQTDRVALLPCAPIPLPIMAITREAAALRPPTRTFTYDPAKEVAGAAVHPEWERLKTAVANLGRKGTSPFGSVDLFVRPHQFNHASVDRMIADLVQMPLVYRVEVEREPITNDVCTYRVQLFVDQEGARRATVAQTAGEYKRVF